jgi:hypothetical protein
MPKFNSGLTPEQRTLLANEFSKFSINMTNEEIAKCNCNHQTEHGYTISRTPDGQCNCDQCHVTFRPLEDLNVDELAASCDYVVDAAQWLKIMNVSGIVPDDAMREYSYVIGLVSKLPELFQVCSKSYNNLNKGTMPAVNKSLNPVNTLQLYNSITSGQMPYMPMNNNYYQNGGMAPLYNNYGQPVQQQAPWVTPQVQQPQMPYGQPMQQQVPYGAQVQMPPSAPQAMYAGQQPLQNMAPTAPQVMGQSVQQMPAGAVMAQPATSTVSAPVVNPMDISSATTPNPTVAGTTQPTPVTVTKTFNV